MSLHRMGRSRNAGENQNSNELFGVHPLARSMQFERRGPPHPSPLPKERESLPTVSRSHWTVIEYLAAKCVSLSLGERVGVRGKVVSNCIVRALGCPGRSWPDALLQ